MTIVAHDLQTVARCIREARRADRRHDDRRTASAINRALARLRATLRDLDASTNRSRHQAVLDLLNDAREERR